MPRRGSGSSWNAPKRRKSWTSDPGSGAIPDSKNGAQPLDEPPDAFGDGRLLQRAVGDAEVAAVLHAERRAGNHRHFVLANQPLGERERRLVGVHAEQAVKGAVRRGHRGERAELSQLRDDDLADRCELADERLAV